MWIEYLIWCAGSVFGIVLAKIAITLMDPSKLTDTRLLVISTINVLMTLTGMMILPFLNAPSLVSGPIFMIPLGYAIGITGFGKNKQSSIKGLNKGNDKGE